MIKLKEITQITGGRLIGDEEVEIRGLSSIKYAKEGDLTFLFRRSFIDEAKSTKASALIVGEDADPKELTVKNIVVTKDPYAAFIKLANLFVKKEEEGEFISPLAHISSDAKIGRKVKIYPFVYVGSGVEIEEGVVLYPFVYVGDRVIIGENSKIYAHVTLYEGVKIGKRVIIHSGTVIGSDGFGYRWTGKEHEKIPQIGTVEIEDDVEIGANVTIDRATLGKTLIKKGTKIDNLVQVGHNVEIGEDSIVVAQVGIGGSTKIGNRVIIAGQAGIRDHVRVGNGVKIGGQTGVTKDVKDGQEVLGTPHMDRKEWARLQFYLRKLPELFTKIKRLEQKTETGELK
ncbi:MAG: UDP-3-O-(3-hydroxymyristoyl)glucosamine N-acyltransferase [Desulfobacterota bacterium]|nr:UDP-3-O-(3-hydroxymyristoyl)glucosamine N-acyltransferase [Thermodesulfobacteriota bacterium]MDW8002041.1 UDP-3-O-(3-hydroxymyristoyl)glucosamine N-acyltransferase [Deltaproteobacteria bacterium]